MCNFKSGCVEEMLVYTDYGHPKKSENLGRCGRQNMLRPNLKTWEWVLGRAVQTISSPGVRSPCLCICSHHTANLNFSFPVTLCSNFFKNYPSQFLSHWEYSHLFNKRGGWYFLEKIST